MTPSKTTPRSKVVKSDTQTWCCSLLEGQAHRDNRLIASLGVRLYPVCLAGSERKKRGGQGLPKRRAKHSCPETHILLSFFLITVYFCLDDFYYLLSTSSPSRSSHRPMISIQWDRDVGRWYKAMPRVTTSDLSWAVSMLQQSAFYCALAWSV